MNNSEIAKIFREIADILEVREIPHKPQAYRRAALALEGLEEDVADIYAKGGKRALEEIPGIGKSLAEKIEEFLLSGKIKKYEELKKELPVNLEELTQVEGLGPKRVYVLYKKLGIKNLEDLEKAAKEHKIAKLEGFGPKSEENILQGIEFLKKSKGRIPLGVVYPIVQKVKKVLSNLKEVKKIEVVGSFRRRKETVGDIDILVVTSNPEKVMDVFCSLEGVVKVWGRGPKKASVHMKEGFDMDLRVTDKESFGASLQYFTGSKAHNIAVRKIAISKGLKLNEYGLFKGEKKIAGATEEEIYQKLGMQVPPPEIREDQGEVELALKHQLPKLVELKDIKGDLHVHSNFDGGVDSIETLALKAQELGYQYLGISDHTKFLRIERGLDEKQLEEERKEIDKLNLKFKKIGFKIFQGAEVNILRDGTLDISDKALAKLDYVIAGVHSNFNMSEKEMTARIKRAMKNPYVTIIAHPTGRLIQKRESYNFDFEEILKTAKATNTILEINSSPERLDLPDKYIRFCVEQGVKLVINTDTHHWQHLRYMELGVGQARRGWAKKEDIINTYSTSEIEKVFKLKRKNAN